MTDPDTCCPDATAARFWETDYRGRVTDVLDGTVHMDIWEVLPGVGFGPKSFLGLPVNDPHFGGAAPYWSDSSPTSELTTTPGQGDQVYIWTWLEHAEPEPTKHYRVKAWRRVLTQKERDDLGAYLASPWCDGCDERKLRCTCKEVPHV